MKMRVLQVSLAIALVCVSSPVVAFQASQSVAPAPEIPAGPSMKETEAWIKRELRPMGSDRIVTRYKGITWGDRYEIESAVLSDCVLTIRQVSQHEGAPNHQTNTSRITMKDVDVRRGLSVTEDPVGTDATASKPSYAINVFALSGRGEPFLSESDGYAGGKTKKSARAVSVHVRDKNMGNQAVEVFRRAAVLCGAPNQTVETGLAKTGPETPRPVTPVTSPPSQGPSKMTNDEVIQLVTAGLSEQVIITSIRQAPAKAFDLTPTGLIALKKAGVSDAVIVVMQERGTPVQAAAAGEAKTPPKYDATLAAPPKPAAAPEAQDGCSGVENMGVYKNEVFSREMGGGVVEWLAKIRNNTSVTKIVDFGWRDMYGQQQRSQVQIRGGEIASPRLDLTQARVIPPVADVRLLSCQ
jgi:hypothetical protein